MQGRYLGRKDIFLRVNRDKVENLLRIKCIKILGLFENIANILSLLRLALQLTFLLFLTSVSILTLKFLWWSPWSIPFHYYNQLL